MVPLAARAYLNRCRPGASGSLQGTAVHKTMPGLGVYAGVSRKCASSPSIHPGLMPAI